MNDFGIRFASARVIKDPMSVREEMVVGKIQGVMVRTLALVQESVR